MKKIYHLSSCSTCHRIIQNLKLTEDVVLQDIKSEKITAEQLDEMVQISGSYETLFSRRAMKYKTMNLKGKEISETEYRSLILGEYTFLKRPVIIIEDSIFIGNSKKEVDAAYDAIHKK